MGRRRAPRPLYLLCRSHTADAQRAYRVDRVRDVEVLDDTFTKPSDLDPVATLERHLAAGWKYDVEVVIAAPLEAVAPCLPRVLGLLGTVDDGTTRLVGSTSNPVWYAEQLAVIPAPFRIVEGTELNQAAREIGQRLIAAANHGDRAFTPAPAAPASASRRRRPTRRAPRAAR